MGRASVRSNGVGLWVHWEGVLRGKSEQLLAGSSVRSRREVAVVASKRELKKKTYEGKKQGGRRKESHSLRQAEGAIQRFIFLAPGGDVRVKKRKKRKEKGRHWEGLKDAHL